MRLVVHYSLMNIFCLKGEEGGGRREGALTLLLKLNMLRTETKHSTTLVNSHTHLSYLLSNSLHKKHMYTYIAPTLYMYEVPTFSQT